MGSASAIVFSGIAPHPPIMVPEVGHEAIAAVRDSIDAMAELTRRLIASGAETVVLISPHAPLKWRAFVAYPSPQIEGDFANFRAPEATVAAVVDEELLDAIAQEAEQQNCSVERLLGRELDHGTAVPLYFLRRNGWHGRVVALGYSFVSNEDHLRFGASVNTAANRVGRLVAFIASGDLSHRLKPEAPAGYDPDAHLFDDEVVAALRANDPDRIINIDQALRRLAGECGYRSMLVALGAARESPPACEVLSYEAPFGVGYLVAQITNCVGPTRRSATTEEGEKSDAAEIVSLARRAIEAFVRTGKQIDPPQKSSSLLSARAACFVSMRTHDGELRGCIGTAEPTKDTLAEELIANAINSATRDPRFPPVRADELPRLRYSVDVLSTPEAATFAELDPLVYGVIVEDSDGSHRGLLLPAIAGIDNATKQVAIAAGKAGIAPGTPLKFLRFLVQRFGEQ